jgi:hypothetical protein
LKIKFWKKSENPLHQNFVERLLNIISILDIFLDISSQNSKNDNFYIKVYDAIHLENGEILRTTGKF